MKRKVKNTDMMKDEEKEEEEVLYAITQENELSCVYTKN